MKSPIPSSVLLGPYPPYLSMTMDISNFYLMTPLHHPEFVCINLIDISDEVIEAYKLKEKATKSGSINILVKRDMYGLPQSGLLANKLLKRQ